MNILQFPENNMQIVKFKDGKYAVRQFTSTGFQYAYMLGEGGEIEWLLVYDKQFFELYTLEDALVLFKHLQEIDYGVPVNDFYIRKWCHKAWSRNYEHMHQTRAFIGIDDVDERTDIIAPVMD